MLRSSERFRNKSNKTSASNQLCRVLISLVKKALNDNYVHAFRGQQACGLSALGALVSADTQALVGLDIQPRLFTYIFV